MPTLSSSRLELNPNHYRRVTPEPVGGVRFTSNPAPEPPIAIRRSPVMISSLPSIATGADGTARQFYGGANVPTRRLILP
jgi:hypothetical protein